MTQYGTTMLQVKHLGELDDARVREPTLATLSP